jgi:parvulin-like peptidyl-prolyl isomerase
MKKFVALIVAVCLLFAGYLTYLSYKPSLISGTADAEVSDSTEAVETQKLDYEAMYALHDPEEVVMIVDNTEINWGEYFSWLYMSAIQTEQYFSAMASYGVEMNWADVYASDAQGRTYAEIASAGAENTLKQILTYIGYADSQGITASAETLSAIVDQRASDKISCVGEDGTEEDFLAYLASIYRSEDAYNRTNLASYINQQTLEDMYGENYENVTDEQAVSYLEDNGYTYANHILLATVDLSTGEALDDETIAAKKAQAEEIAAELQAIEDSEELLARFKELKEDYCEDNGKAYYPDGYVFQDGTMNSAFEEACKALNEYQVSDIVESSYGYHIIIRLPLDPDATVSYSSSTGLATTARELYATTQYTEALDEYLDNMSVQYMDGFEQVDLTKYIK